LGLLDGAVVATEIKKVKPHIPIVMLADHLELPDGALKSVDALVTKSDGAHFLWSAVHFVLKMKPTLRDQSTLSAQAPVRHRHTDRALRASDRSHANLRHREADQREAPFSRSDWRSIRDGSIKF
jgi:hypothetical protein